MREVIKVLLIDDDEDDYLITCDLIEDIVVQDYQLDWAGSYHQALEKIKQAEHDVYIVDYRLGAKNGLEIIEEAKNEGNDKPFILLTGQGDFEIDEKAMNLGAFDYLVKGKLDAAQLEKSIRHSIQHSQNLQKIRQLNEELEERVHQRTHQLNEAVLELQQMNHDLQKEIKERKRAEEALRESQHIYQTISQNFPNGIICVLDANLRFVFVEGKELHSLGLNPEELTGKFLPNAKELFAQGNSSLTQSIKSAFNGEEVMLEVQFRNRQYSFNAVPMPDSEGKVKQILVVAMNITDQKKAENEIRKALNKEKELNELKGRFVSMASHEFRTPLSTILSSVSLISRYNTEEQAEKRNKHINRIKSSVNNLTQILNDFLSISKLEEGKAITHLSKINLSAFIDEVCDEMSAVKKPNQRIVYTHTGEAIDFKTDGQLLKNILINLISNAIKYSGNDKNIWVTSSNEENDITISVKDEGIGIPETDQQYLFSRFFRAENAINIQGTGLGLYIVKKYLDLVDGQIEFESIPDQGTTFKITIPKQTYYHHEKDSSDRR
ncbi:ATP-binding protein [Limibacter armeniacum]|uniref:hybrid sensor histidine kinase/response regulator n=1 Tax=Limibacter armeniacum TaxID=466084 RepID=UPI002FE6206E